MLEMKLDGSTAFGFQRVLEERRQSHSRRTGWSASRARSSWCNNPSSCCRGHGRRRGRQRWPPRFRYRGWMGKLAAGTRRQPLTALAEGAYRNLRTNESIVQQLDRWRQCATSVAEGSEPGISKEEYIQISRLIFKAAVRPFDDAGAGLPLVIGETMLGMETSCRGSIHGLCL